MELATAYVFGSTDVRIAGAGRIFLLIGVDLRTVDLANVARCALSIVLRVVFRGNVVF